MSSLSPSDPGDLATRQTIRLALACYTLAVLLMLRLDAAGWSARSPMGRGARWTWTVGWLVYLVHVGLAFHTFHHWSHAEAVAHVEQRSGFGPGIAFSHLFTLAWSADVAWWWFSPSSLATRPRWINQAFHAFLFFMVFNATVVYETGLVRVAGLLVTLLFALGVVYRRLFPPIAR